MNTYNAMGLDPHDEQWTGRLAATHNAREATPEDVAAATQLLGHQPHIRGAQRAIVDMILDYESGTLPESHIYRLFAQLIKTRQVWTMQGAYGRMAARFIDEGRIGADGVINPDWDGEVGDGELHCDHCNVVEFADELTPDWNDETGNHLSCEADRP